MAETFGIVLLIVIFAMLLSYYLVPTKKLVAIAVAFVFGFMLYALVKSIPKFEKKNIV